MTTADGPMFLAVRDEEEPCQECAKCAEAAARIAELEQIIIDYVARLAHA